MNSKIILTDNFDEIQNELIAECGINQIRIFKEENFLLQNAKNAVDEAYIAEKELKTIVLIGEKFGIEAQNALLLILEEPPKNIRFILVSSSKNIFLPTIRSRLIIENRLQKKQRVLSGLNLKKLSLRDINEFVEEKIALERKREFSKNDLLNLVSGIVMQAFEEGIKFNEKELEYINKLTYLINLNTKSHAILTPLLLMIGEKH
ncbi:DNA polymerase III, delta prime subunit [Campylobacter blaseri]|uniref:DNA polymerase III subunit delta n=1 Tax=Campylobacter blaseri TaxID=2042961 RepID=A0A2P8R219_9BACT|nr:DNA polymerase III subunit delta' [Campylobacter blaseri]PSM52546.1 DNA polymerase III subunit delta' [Campylobacter blaseri]PSM54194.1 DNA polymerase III subunit delta' [Campylobacter blaseri]QKF85845.1 DNA polymerase III, delta prime subunit [Campylobacter blaseri]